MGRTARYWLAFAIVAVGLALSWGQVGRKTQRVLEQVPVVYLQTEQPCRPRRAPCAAFAEDRALVLGPGPHGLALKPAGWPLSDIARVETVELRADATESGTSVPVRDHDGWSIPSPQPDAAVLRVRVSESGDLTVADFPL